MAFAINIYNALVVHALVEVGPATNALQRRASTAVCVHLLALARSLRNGKPIKTDCRRLSAEAPPHRRPGSSTIKWGDTVFYSNHWRCLAF